MIAVGVVCIAKHAYVVGVPVAAIGFVLLIGVSMYASAAGMYMRTILYRFATDQPIPDLGVDPSRSVRNPLGRGQGPCQLGWGRRGCRSLVVQAAPGKARKGSGNLAALRGAPSSTSRRGRVPTNEGEGAWQT